MGYSKASKANTHARLVESAAARFKERGVDGISLADLMKDLKLTHGGFYKHFASRDELVNEALDLALSSSGEVMREHLYDGDKPNLARFVDFYLNEDHRDDRAAGCAVAALAGDAPRKSAGVQQRFREHIERTLAALGDALCPGSPTERRETALLVLSSLYGALMMARAVGDSPLSSEVLRTVRKRVVKLTSAKGALTSPKRVLTNAKRVTNLTGAKMNSQAQSRTQTRAPSKAREN
jgi:TetR/AcrR family transcriptional regulator, transcriptional repressor for nem operon